MVWRVQLGGANFNFSKGFRPPMLCLKNEILVLLHCNHNCLRSTMVTNCTLSPESNWVLCCGGLWWAVVCCGVLWCVVVGQSTFQMHSGRECTLQCSDWKQHFFPPRASISAKAWKYDTGRTKIVWGLHLLISTYFPPAFQAPISLCVKTDTTHFKVTRSPTHKKGPKRYRTSSPNILK